MTIVLSGVMSTPAHKDLRLYDEVDLSARSTDLPTVYIYDKPHPQRPPSSQRGRDFVVLVDVSTEGKRRALSTHKDLEAPSGRESEMLSVYGTMDGLSRGRRLTRSRRSCVPAAGGLGIRA